MPSTLGMRRSVMIVLISCSASRFSASCPSSALITS